MGTVSLLKCYKPHFFSMLFPHSTPPRTHATFFRRKNLASFCAGSSPPLPVAKDCCKPDSAGLTLKNPSPEVWLHNTMSKTKELFKPKVESKVGMYVCGVTAYDLSHIGHARVYVNFDLLYRFLSSLHTHLIQPYFTVLVIIGFPLWQLGRYFKHLGFQVCYVRNFTDVDDKVCLYLLFSFLF